MGRSDRRVDRSGLRDRKGNGIARHEEVPILRKANSAVFDGLQVL